MLKPTYNLPPLPPPGELETTQVFREMARAHRHLGELKGRATSMPNQGILIDTLSLQEAKASSEIENIVTTQDELFQASFFPPAASPAAKEVALYRDALKLGFDQLRKTGLLTNNTIISMFQLLKRTTGEFRDTPGTALKNEATGDLVYVPPQDKNTIVAAMSDLEKFINDDSLCSLDPLIKMAVIHHQFESIHPFPDGNGRIGRIINVLYLTQQGLLEIPILYLSRYITEHKGQYYSLLQSTRDTGEWQEWLLYMMKAVSESSIHALTLIDGIKELMENYKNRLRTYHYKIYSHDLLNNLFRHPYTRIDFVQSELEVSRQTAAKYLDQLAEGGLLLKQQHGRNNYYVNVPLVNLFTNAPWRSA
ncbi:Fic family protein [Nitrospirillum sp. BR 11752]|uniref:Fic family protein n=1 Tax=Nitrospirillum sp. BR 11752 TaxID=3104293 RepID=UPI002ECDCF81|nr:Fic family protein [Nitrospirillum sp. BR 11752]